MLKTIMAVADYQYFSAVALGIFFVFSCLVGVWIYRPNSKKNYESIAKQALED